MSRAHTEAGPAVRPSVATRNWTILVLLLANLIGYVDRNILSLLVQPIKDSLGLSDGQVGLMQGLSFVSGFLIASLIVGRLVDTGDRRRLLLGCLLFWTACSSLAGASQTATQLFLTRMGVGFGEAAIIPVAVSLIGDYFQETERGRAFGVFGSGSYAGTGLSLFLVGLLLPYARHMSDRLATGGTIIEPWRLVLASTALPGLLACILVWTMKEPPRAVSTARGGRGQGLADWWSKRSFFVPHSLSGAFGALGLYALIGWMPTILSREHQIDVGKTGIVFGAVIAVTGVICSMLGGVLSDRFSATGGALGRVRFGIISLVVALMAFLALRIVTDPIGIVIASTIIFAVLSMMVVTYIISMSAVATVESRGLATSIYLFVSGIIASAGGPALIGYINDAIRATHGTLSSVLTAVGCAAAGLAILSALVAAAALKRGEAHWISPR